MLYLNIEHYNINNNNNNNINIILFDNYQTIIIINSEFIIHIYKINHIIPFFLIVEESNL